MKVDIDSDVLLKLCNRHKAKTLAALEEISCPKAYLDIIRIRFSYLRNDLIDATSNPKLRG